MHNDTADDQAAVGRPRLRTDLLILSFLLACNLSIISGYLLPWALFGHIISMFAVDGEANLPAWWSSVQLLLAGLLILLVALRVRTVERYGWTLALLGGLLVIMSADETIGLHERVGIFAGSRLLGMVDTSSADTSVWAVLVAIPVVAVLLAALERFGAFEGSAPGSQRHFLYGFVVLLIGSTVTEIADLFPLPNSQDAEMIILAIEELAELSGGSLLLWASMLFAREHWSTQAIRMLFRPSTLSEKRAYERMRRFETEQEPQPEPITAPAG